MTGAFAELYISITTDQREFTWLGAGNAVVSLSFQTECTVGVSAIDVGSLFEYFGSHSINITIMFHKSIVLGIDLYIGDE